MKQRVRPKQKHSKGPWTFEDGLICGVNGGVLARVPHALCSGEIDAVNGQLMTTAPELLQAGDRLAKAVNQRLATLSDDEDLHQAIEAWETVAKKARDYKWSPGQ